MKRVPNEESAGSSSQQLPPFGCGEMLLNRPFGKMRTPGGVDFNVWEEAVAVKTHKLFTVEGLLPLHQTRAMISTTNP